MVKALSWMYCFLVFTQLVLLRPAAAVSIQLEVFCIVSCCFLFFLLKKNLFEKSSANYLSKIQIYNHYAGKTFIIILIVLLLCSPWLNLPIHTWGDEDHHFQIFSAQISYLKQYLSFQIPEGPAPSVNRYPSLVNLISLPFISILWGNSLLILLQRISSIITLVFLIYFLFKVIKKNGLDLVSQFNFVVAYICTPLLFSFITDRYLDVAHPFFMCVSIWFAIQTSKYKIKNYALTAALLGGLTSLVRDNTFPFNFVLSLCLAGICWQKFDFKFSIKILILASLPTLIYILVKQNASGLVDSQRLSLSNIVNQDLGLFFNFWFFYFPICSSVLFFLGVKKLFEERHYLIIILVFFTLFFQLFLYLVFQPGWIPWARNYLMFYGCIVAISLYGYINYIQKNQLLRILMILTILTNFFIYFFLFKNNKFFHQNEIVFRYDEALTDLKDLNLKKGDLYMNAPLLVPYSLTKEISDANINPNIFYPHLNKLNGFKFLTFKEILSDLNKQKYILFHFREAKSFMSILNNFPFVRRPTEEELRGFKILRTYFDPWSENQNGLMIIENMDFKN